MAASKLVRWLPEVLPASATDIARFGPNAARVNAARKLFDSLSQPADFARISSRYSVDPETAKAAERSLREAALNADSSWLKGRLNRLQTLLYGLPDDAMIAESVGIDALPKGVYESITTPLATGRAVDVLRRRYPEGPFLDLVSQLSERKAITNPLDVLTAGRLSLPSEDDYRDIALMLLAEGEPLEQAIRGARNMVRGR